MKPALTELLARHRGGGGGGNDRVVDAIFDLAIPELRSIARNLMSRERFWHTLQPTALVNEAFLRMFDGNPASWEDSKHFLRSAAAEMRRVLLDHARSASTGKRKHNVDNAADVSLIADCHFTNPQLLVELGSALEELNRIHARAADVTDLLVFAGLSLEEAADVLGVSSRTVGREWRWTRAWLRGYLTGDLPTRV